MEALGNMKTRLRSIVFGLERLYPLFWVEIFLVLKVFGSKINFLEGKHWDLKKYLWSKIFCSKVVESKKIMGLSKVQGPIKLLV